MDNKMKAPLPGSKAGPESTLRQNNTRHPLKWERVLQGLLGGQSFNRFEAERELHDHCLHTTVSILQQKGVVVHRRDEVISGYAGIPTHVCRYWLAPESQSKAFALLHPTKRPEQGGENP